MLDGPRLYHTVRLLHGCAGNPSLRHVRLPDVTRKLT